MKYILLVLVVGTGYLVLTGMAKSEVVNKCGLTTLQMVVDLKTIIREKDRELLDLENMLAYKNAEIKDLYNQLEVNH